jgi:sugar lactone lactonase YvrE
MANAVAIGTDGEIFVTAAGDRFPRAQGSDLPKEFPASGVLGWSSGSGWRTIPSGITGLSNGIVISADGRFLYAADWLKKTITQIDLERTGAYRAVTVDFLPDNLRWGSDGALWVAGQNASVQAVFECFTSRRTSCGLASGVAEIDPAAMTVTCQQEVPATAQFSSATTALQFGREVWFGSFRNPSIVTMPLPSRVRGPACVESGN